MYCIQIFSMIYSLWRTYLIFLVVCMYVYSVNKAWPGRRYFVLICKLHVSCCWDQRQRGRNFETTITVDTRNRRGRNLYFLNQRQKHPKKLKILGISTYLFLHFFLSSLYVPLFCLLIFLYVCLSIYLSASLYVTFPLWMMERSQSFASVSRYPQIISLDIHCMLHCQGIHNIEIERWWYVYMIYRMFIKYCVFSKF